MKFILGIIIGIAVGGYLASNMTDEQRTKIGEAAGKAGGSVKQSKLGAAVADNAAKVTDTVSERAADAVDTAGDKVADAVSADDDASVS